MEILLNNRYLLSCDYVDELIDAYIVMITETSFQLFMNNTYVWMLKETFHNNYTIVENITQYGVYSEVNQCTCENGLVFFEDGSRTGGLRLCPVCFGKKYCFNKS